MHPMTLLPSKSQSSNLEFMHFLEKGVNKTSKPNN